MRRAFITAVLLGAAAVLLTVGANTVRASDPLANVSDEASVNAILSRACQDCHSDNTAWPWYSHLPTVGAAIRNDVSAGRAQLNLSRWSQYKPEQKEEALAEIAALVRNHLMPPSRYTLLHPGARLSDEDIRRLTQWTSAERRKIHAQTERR
ncbi:MAG TPA: heme-binding domain-containing protein [Bryobacteraceae bacterium]|nr:heme-binding domain-containing protein [Bryobacteraceae bacterium]